MMKIRDLAKGIAAAMLGGAKLAVKATFASWGSIVTAVVTMIVVIVVAKDIINSTYVIDEIAMPVKLASAASGKDELATMLRDEIGRLTRIGYIDFTPEPEVIESDPPEIKVAGNELSLAFVTTLVRRVFGRDLKHISGNLAQDDAAKACATPDKIPFGSNEANGSPVTYHLTLRMSGNLFGPFFDRSGCLDELMRDGAIAALKLIDPVTAAGALSALESSSENKELALLLVDTTIAAQERNNGRGATYRALLMRGLIEMRMDRFDEAASDFEDANEAFKKNRVFRNSGWHMAEDGLAYAFIKLANAAFDSQLANAEFDYQKGDDGYFGAAEAALKRAQHDMPDYDSALYHLAMIDDLKARHAFQVAESEKIDLSRVNLCKGYDEVAAARVQYASLLKKYPDFAIANFDWAVMALQEMTFLQGRKRSRCDTIPDASLRDVIGALAAETENHLRLALLSDPTYANTHRQYAYLLIQLQEPTYIQPSEGAIDATTRAVLLCHAKAELAKAVELSSDDVESENLLRKIDNQLKTTGARDLPSGCAQTAR